MSLNELHKKLEKHLDEQSKNWKSFIYAQEKGFYQGFEELEIDGWRPSKKRFNSYKINDYLSEKKVALDIGSNCGFFSLYVSKFVKQIDGVEINPYLINIANDVKQYTKSLNSNFFNSSFENFFTEKKYDVIFSISE